eukprot:CAMPEP_0203869444 /NCGR_PEP_ID=MMETSP0359-20131031/17705_1 /ASSEMBLY_ACC=CAM_ASM_000338 /TAXON_ID=268821 /ORGANISM="Scrippsiella Hangoei, Strain SHTV-5" /LENGTH=465 /DNA_ID=CAMNT_0050788055 /DNA_START=87 /DNA_END=1484 /DNA_ORIENTATION=+
MVSHAPPVKNSFVDDHHEAVQKEQEERAVAIGCRWGTHPQCRQARVDPGLGNGIPTLDDEEDDPEQVAPEPPVQVVPEPDLEPHFVHNASVQARNLPNNVAAGAGAGVGALQPHKGYGTDPTGEARPLPYTADVFKEEERHCAGDAIEEHVGSPPGLLGQDESSHVGVDDDACRGGYAGGMSPYDPAMLAQQAFIQQMHHVSQMNQWCQYPFPMMPPWGGWPSPGYMGDPCGSKGGAKGGQQKGKNAAKPSDRQSPTAAAKAPAKAAMEPSPRPPPALAGSAGSTAGGGGGGGGGCAVAKPAAPVAQAQTNPSLERDPETNVHVIRWRVDAATLESKDTSAMSGPITVKFLSDRVFKIIITPVTQGDSRGRRNFRSNGVGKVQLKCLDTDGPDNEQLNVEFRAAVNNDGSEEGIRPARDEDPIRNDLKAYGVTGLGANDQWDFRSCVRDQCFFVRVEVKPVMPTD